MHSTFLIASFREENSLLKAVRAVRAQGLRIQDVFSPYPVHGLDKAMGIRRSRLPWVTLVAGLTGLSLALSFQFYADVFDWPMNVGGKPNNLTLAFLPISFELTVLIGGLTTVAALLLRARLFPGKEETLVVDSVTDDVFALVLRMPGSFEEEGSARRIFKECGASDVRRKEGGR